MMMCLYYYLYIIYIQQKYNYNPFLIIYPYQLHKYFNFSLAEHFLSYLPFIFLVFYLCFFSYNFFSFLHLLFLFNS